MTNNALSKHSFCFLLHFSAAAAINFSIFQQMVALMIRSIQVLLLFDLEEAEYRPGLNRELCGQSYNHFMLVNYDSSVVIWGIFKSGTTLEA